jgi:presenilin-like A22 family membrane protease
VNEDNQRISLNIFDKDLKFLDNLHRNRSEAIRLLIMFYKTNQPSLIRSFLQNISISFIALGVFFILANWISYIFLIIAIIIFAYEILDIVKVYKIRHRLSEASKA